MAFWRDAIGADTKRAFRWVVYLGISEVPRIAAKKIDKPKFEVNTVEHHYMGHKFKFPGIMSWQDISATFVDFGFGDDTVMSLLKYISKAGYHPPINESDLSNSMSKSRSVASLGLIKIAQLDEEGGETETWMLHNAWISAVSPSTLDYSSDELSEVEVTIVYDWAELNTPPTRQRVFP